MPNKDLEGGPPWVIIAFMVNLLVGLIASQVAPLVLSAGVFGAWHATVEVLTMVCLSYIMINVGFEFDLDTSNLRRYGVDFAIAMSAAGLPALLVALWFVYALPDAPGWSLALLAGLFAAPTSAGILFSMLEAAGLKETWLFEKARVLAVFDDLGTLLLLVPLKILVGGFSWELCLEVGLVFLMLGIAYRKLHRLPLASSWRWTALYALLVTGSCRLLHYATNAHLAMEAIEMEVLLPAFCLGCTVKVAQHSGLPTGSKEEEEESVGGSGIPPQGTRTADRLGERVHTGISMIFMGLVGLSMPSFFGERQLDGHGGHGHHEPEVEPAEPGARLDLGMTAFHVFVVSLLMVAGKMVPTACYRKDADLKTRFALSLGMCPRGEVGAGVIVISLNLGMQGTSVTIAVLSLAVNLVLSSVFIMLVKRLLRSSPTMAAPIADHQPVAGSVKEVDVETGKHLHEAAATNEAPEHSILSQGAAGDAVRPALCPPVSPGTEAALKMKALTTRADGLPVLLGTASI